MTTTEAQESRTPTNVRWAVFTLTFGSSWLLYLHRYAFSFIKPSLQEEFGLSETDLGLLDSAFSMSYTLFQFPFGVAADAIGVHFVMSGLIVLWSVGLGMHAWAPSSHMLWYARVVLGLGQSAAFACINSIARTWFPLSIRTTLQGMVGVLAGRLGGLSAGLLFSTLLIGVLKFDWRSAIWILTAAGILHAVAFASIFRNSPRRHPRVNEAEADLIEGGPAAATAVAGAKKKMPLGTMLRSMSPRSLLNLFALNMQTILSTFADNIYSNWIPLFLYAEHQLKFKEMGIYSSLPLLGGAIAGVLGGMLNDLVIRTTGNRRWARSGVAFCGKWMAAVILFTAMLFYDNPYLFCGLLFFVKLFGDWSLTSSWGTVTDIGGRATASVFAFNNSVAGIGSIGGPIVYGYIAEHWGWPWVFRTAGCAYILCALMWLMINCTIPLISENAQTSEADEGA